MAPKVWHKYKLVLIVMLWAIVKLVHIILYIECFNTGTYFNTGTWTYNNSESQSKENRDNTELHLSIPANLGLCFCEKSNDPPTAASTCNQTLCFSHT